MKCWIFHKWSGWFDPKATEVRWGGDKVVEVRMLQERRCLRCNKRKVREAY